MNFAFEVSDTLAISRWCLKALENSWIWGPFEFYKFPGVHTSPVLSIFSGGKDRFIHHLSYPKTGISVNSELDPIWRTVQYEKLINFVKFAKYVGKSGYM